MARNKVQFQKGLSERRFRELYGTEQQCRAVAFGWRWPNGFVCPRCGGGRYSEIKGRRLYQCSRCRHQASLTAGTVFHSTNLPLSLWFQAIYLITQSKTGISSLELARRLGVTQTTAWKVQHKLAQVMLEREADKPVGGGRQTGGNGRRLILAGCAAAASGAAGRQARHPSSWPWRPPTRAGRTASSSGRSKAFARPRSRN